MAPLSATFNRIREDAMPILKKSPKAEKQLNVKITEAAYQCYHKVKEACRSKGWEFSLQPDFESWLTTQLVAAEKELAAADKADAKQATEAGAAK